MGSSAAALRTQHRAAALRRPAAINTLVVGACAALVAGAATGDWRKALAFPAIWCLGVVGVIAWWAAQRGEQEFHVLAAQALRMDYLGPADLVPLTPLLGAGDRRSAEHAMRRGELTLAQYRFEVTREDGDRRETVVERHDFTVCVADLGEAAMHTFRGLYLQPRTGALARLGRGDWLANRGLEDVELESIAFNERYRLRATRSQDELAIRRLFSPSLVLMLAEHPLRPGIELRAGGLVVYTRERLEDLGRLTWLRDVALEVSERARAELPRPLLT